MYRAQALIRLSNRPSPIMPSPFRRSQTRPSPFRPTNPTMQNKTNQNHSDGLNYAFIEPIEEEKETKGIIKNVISYVKSFF